MVASGCLASYCAVLAVADSSLGQAVDAVNAWLLALATSPWVLVVVFAVAWVDGFFPPIPSVTVVVAAAASFAAARNWPMELVLPLVAAAGSLAGDVTGHWLGRFFRLSRWRVFRQGRGGRAFAWVERSFHRTSTSLIMVARYIPTGRAAVNLTAGSIHFPRRHFVVLSAAAGLVWSVYAAAFGSLAARVAWHDPLLSVVVGVVAAVLVGLVVQRLISRRFGRTDQ